jgi:acylphosphatase
MKLLKIRIRGLVQGVGFRYFAYRNAAIYGISGFVRNEADGSIYLQICGDPDSLSAYCDELRRGPSRSNITEFTILEEGICNDDGEFFIA